MATRTPHPPEELVFLDACPNCGAPTSTEEHGFCHFCDALLLRPAAAPLPPGPPAPPPPQVPTPAATGNGWKVLVMFLVLYGGFCGLGLIGTAVSAVFGLGTTTTTSASTRFTTLTTPTTRATTTTTAKPTAPDLDAPVIKGDGNAAVLDCSAGQSYVLQGNAQTVTATGACGTIVVDGNGLRVRLERAEEIWVTGNGNNTYVTEVGAITSIGNVNHTEWTRGIDGAEPAINNSHGGVKRAG